MKSLVVFSVTVMAGCASHGAPSSLALARTADASAGASIAAPHDAFVLVATSSRAASSYLVTFKRRGARIDELVGQCRQLVAGMKPGDEELAKDYAAVVDQLAAETAKDQQPFTAFVESKGGKVVRHWYLINGCHVTIDSTMLDELRKDASVAAVVPDGPITASCRDVTEAAAGTPIKRSTNASNHNALALQTGPIAAQVWGAGVGIAIIDSGVAMIAHDDAPARPHRVYYKRGDLLAPSSGLSGSRLYVRQVGLLAPEADPDHGFGVTSVAAGGMWGDVTDGANGHAPEAAIVVYTITDGKLPDGKTFFSDDSTVIEALHRIPADRYTRNIVAVNCSRRGSGWHDPLNSVQQAMDSLARDFDVLIAASAGNIPQTVPAGSPGATNILAVGMVHTDSHVLADESARGPLPDGRSFPDLTANGAGPGATDALKLPDRKSETGTITSSGTSLAAPHVSGAATLYRSKKLASALETKAAILATTDDIGAANPASAGIGAGYLRDDKLIEVARGHAFVRNETVAVGASKKYVLTVQAGKQYTAALAWFRQDTTTVSWSNLDLTVREVGGPWSTSSTSPKNLYERVAFTRPAVVDIEIEVKAVALEPGLTSIAFSLVVPGDFTTAGSAEGTPADAGVKKEDVDK